MSSRLIQIQTIKSGDGKTFPRKGKIVTCHYDAMFPDGSVFDSSRSRNQPFEFQLGIGEVITGWELALVEVSLGQKFILNCPPEFAYGKTGLQGVVPPNTPLVFEIEVLAIK